MRVVRAYKLELALTLIQRLPPRVIELKNSHLITKEVHQLLVKGAIRMVTPCQSQFFSRIFVVPKKDGSHRPVINLRSLNQFMIEIHGEPGHNERPTEAGQLDGFDSLEEVYLSVLVWEGHQKYLRYMWQETAYAFQSPFGLYSAPRDFTKLLKPVLAWLHHQGVRVVMYLDDMLIMSQLKDELERQLSQTTSLLERLDFVINRKKSFLQPIQSIRLLGFMADSQEILISLTEEKVTQIIAACKRVQTWTNWKG